MMRQLVCCAALLFLCTSCQITSSETPSAVIAGTHGIGDENETVNNKNNNKNTDNNETPVTPTPEPPTFTPEAADDPTPTAAPSPTDEPAAPTAVSLPEDIADPSPIPLVAPPDLSGLPNDKLGWYTNRNKDHLPPVSPCDFDIQEYDAYYLGDTSQKYVYLTFDEGYEEGFTGPILDVLKEKNVQAAFFLTGTYITSNPELVARMSAEGHAAGNHSVHHPSFPDITDAEVFAELNETARCYQETTGHTMGPFFRPPMGEYSVRTLALTQSAGYQTFFWSFAHRDWLVSEQPSLEDTFNLVMDNLHNGAILLLHAVSESNTLALPDIIDAIRAQGYEFRTLYDFI